MEKENPFGEGDKVVCISESFPLFRTTEEDKSQIGIMPANHPKKNEVLTIDEILGTFLRFSKYDTENWEWWHHTRFVPFDDEQRLRLLNEAKDLIESGNGALNREGKLVDIRENENATLIPKHEW